MNELALFAGAGGGILGGPYGGVLRTRGVVGMNTLESIVYWFQYAAPKPTKENLSIQVGCHLEEVAEFTTEIGKNWVSHHLEDIAHQFKTEKPEVWADPVPTLDALCDQIVTAVGVAYMAGWDIVGALEEVNRSNWSKFLDGKPVFDAQGKIAKGPEFKAPDLKEFV
jgi:predicted HAD superfamily Cof-like phosphohydrolase